MTAQPPSYYINRALNDSQSRISNTLVQFPVQLSDALIAYDSIGDRLKVSNPISMSGGVVSGKVTGAGAAVSLNSDTNLVGLITIRAAKSNAIQVQIGNVNGQNYPLDVGDTVPLQNAVPANTYFSGQSGQVVTFIYGE